MAELEMETSVNNGVKPRRLHFEWVLPLFFRPARTLKKVVEQDHPVWQTPLLILSVLAILVVLVGAPIRTQLTQQVGELPPDFQYWPPDQQEQYYASQANKANPMFIYLFPALGVLIGIWLSWFLLGSILHLALTLSGSRGSSGQAINLVAWASLPFALRFIVTALAILINKRLIASAGVSGFIAADAEGFTAFIRILLTFVDIYLIWQLILLMIGSLPLTGLSRGKAWTAVFVTVLLMLVLQAVPGYVSSLLSGLSLTRGFFF
jgi:hypothetical protein